MFHLMTLFRRLFIFNCTRWKEKRCMLAAGLCEWSVLDVCAQAASSADRRKYSYDAKMAEIPWRMVPGTYPSGDLQMRKML